MAGDAAKVPIGLRRVIRLPFGDAAIPAIADELGVAITPAPYDVAGERVWEGRIPARWAAGISLHLVLWPSICRVDVRIVPDGGGRTPIALTARSVHAVEVYPGVEVMFRRAGGSVLFVTRHGHAAVAD